MLLTTSASRLEAPARAFLTANKSTLGTVTALGKSPTVSDAALAAAKAAVS